MAAPCIRVYCSGAQFAREILASRDIALETSADDADVCVFGVDESWSAEDITRTLAHGKPIVVGITKNTHRNIIPKALEADSTFDSWCNMSSPPKLDALVRRLTASRWHPDSTGTKGKIAARDAVRKNESLARTRKAERRAEAVLRELESDKRALEYHRNEARARDNVVERERRELAQSRAKVAEVINAGAANALADATCVVCFDRPAVMTCVPCGHICLCPECGPAFVKGICPICRHKVDCTLRIYHSAAGQ